MTLSDDDRQALHDLLQASTEVRNMMSQGEMTAVLSGDFQAAFKAAQTRHASVCLQTAHVVAYDIILEGGGFPTPMEHLSVSHPQNLNEADVLTIAIEFGLGDRSTWSMHMPPMGPIRAYHIFRKIAGNSS